MILKEGYWSRRNAKFVVESHSRKRFCVITRLNFDENLISDKFVSVWKLRFWASVIIWEYIWTFASMWSLETL